jgi:hypothetical protein
MHNLYDTKNIALNFIREKFLMISYMWHITHILFSGLWSNFGSENERAYEPNTPTESVKYFID